MAEYCKTNPLKVNPMFQYNVASAERQRPLLAQTGHYRMLANLIQLYRQGEYRTTCNLITSWSLTRDGDREEQKPVLSGCEKTLSSTVTVVDLITLSVRPAVVVRCPRLSI